MNKRNLAKEIARINRQYEDFYLPKVEAKIKAQVSSLKEVVKENGVDAGFGMLMRNPVAVDLKATIEALYKRVGLRHANRETMRLRQTRGYKHSAPDMQLKGFGFNMEWTNFILEYFRIHLRDAILAGVNESLRESLIKVLSRAIEQGKGVAEIVRELDELRLSRTQAARIVRTEINSASNLGSMAAGKTFNYEQQKEWISAEDSRVRGTNPEDHANHVSLDGTIIDYEDYFKDKRNGVELLHPGDPKARGSRKDVAASVINCRCQVALIAKRDRNGRLIPKRRTTAVVTSFVRTNTVVTI